MNSEALSALREKLTDQEFLRLTLYARRLAGLLYWRRGADVLPHGESPESVVLRVVEKLISGRNHWDSDCVSLIAFLRVNIRRELYHLSRSAENQLKENSFQSLETTPHIIQPGDDPFKDEMVDGFLRFIGGDPGLRRVCEQLLAGQKPRQVADSLNLARADIYAKKKRLRRLLRAYFEGLRVPFDRKERKAQHG